MLLNLFAYGRRFFDNGWLWFDAVVVTASVVLLFAESGGANAVVKQMRILRAFRLLRLMTRFNELRRIVDALVVSIVPTLQAQVRQCRHAAQHRRTPPITFSRAPDMRFFCS